MGTFFFFFFLFFFFFFFFGLSIYNDYQFGAFFFFFFFFWWRYAGSNRGPLACHASALPAELYPHFSIERQPNQLGMKAIAFDPQKKLFICSSAKLLCCVL
eukprot:TRINITY_DN831_c0_g1_i21.p3 TRINITY_DN831_c0_g1~~TRINITY_DN831_c0_g1_i21.p3  ORF type:complete len:101 (+),score=20.72 TRINITY_DN831_c0_g1_i21:71-373(+)